MLKLNTKPLEKMNYYPMALPEIFWVDGETNNNYYTAHRSIDSILEQTNNPFLVSKYNKKLIGTMCWVCLDTTNGNPELYYGTIHCWIFKTKEQALKQYRTHKENKKLAKLNPPVCYVVIDQLKNRYGDTDYYG